MYIKKKTVEIGLNWDQKKKKEKKNPHDIINIGNIR